jgi:AraC-like DNA-binding protein
MEPEDAAGPLPRWIDASKETLTDRDHVRGLPVREHCTVQLGGGPVVRQSAWVSGRDVVLGFMRVRGQCATTVQLDPGWTVVHVPPLLLSETSFNGRLLTTGEVILWANGQDFITSGGDRASWCLGLRTERLRANWQALRGLKPGDGDLPSLVFAPTARALSQFVQSVQAIYDTGLSPSAAEAAPGLSPLAEATILSVMGQLLLSNQSTPMADDQGSGGALQVVRRVQSCFAVPEHPATLAELCAVAGVGVTWLHKCFQEVYGISPVQYVLARRLSAVREKLLDGDDPPRSVKDAALAQGFFETGRFAQYYQRAFGERPSDTFRKNPTKRA